MDIWIGQNFYCHNDVKKCKSCFKVVCNVYCDQAGKVCLYCRCACMWPQECLCTSVLPVASRVSVYKCLACGLNSLCLV